MRKTMEDPEFVERLKKTFPGAKMADVARRLEVPHATVQNYYRNDRIPATEVLIKIAEETSVSLNWLLLGTGDMFAVHRPPIGLGQFIEEKIGEMIEEKFAGMGSKGSAASTAGSDDSFDVEAMVLSLNDPQAVMNEWFRHEGRAVPKDYGVVFFRGWENFSPEDKIEAVRDAKRVLDRGLRSGTD